MALADRAELAVRLTLDDRSFTGPLRRVSGNLGRLDRATGNTQRALGRTGAALQRTAVIAAAAAGGGFLAAVRAAGDFEDAFAGIVKTVDAPTERLDELRKQIRAMALEIPVAATELAAIGETAGALGINVADIDEFIEVVAKLGATTNLTTDEAAESLGKIGTILGLSGAEFEAFGDVLVNLGNKGASTEAEIIEITKRFAATGKQAGLTIPQILGFASAIASAGAEPEAAGSSLSRLFGNLITETALASDKARAFADVAGLSFKDFANVVEKDTNAAMLLFLDNLGDLDKFAQQKALKEVGITNVRDRNAILLLAQTYEKNLIPALENAATSTGALGIEAAKRFDTFSSKTAIFQNTLNDLGIVIGDRLIPKITPLLDEFSLWVANNGPAIERFGDDVASAFTEVADTIRNLPWDSIKAGLAGSLALAKGVVDVFKGLPGPLQAALIGGFVLNKATGGLVTGVGKDVAMAGLNKLLTGSFLGRGSSPASPMWVQQVGGGGLGGAGGAAKGGIGILGTLLSAVVLAEVLSAVQKHVIEPGLQEQAGKNVTGTEAIIAGGDRGAIMAALAGTRAGVSGLSGLQKVLYDLNANGVRVHTEGLIAALEAALVAANAKTTAATGLPPDAHDSARNTAAIDRVRAANERTYTAVERLKSSAMQRIDAGARMTTAAQAAGAAAIVAAIHGIRLNVNVPLSVNVTDSRITRTYQGGQTLARSSASSGSGDLRPR